MSTININGQIALTNFKDFFFAKVKNKEGKEEECIVIPLSRNYLKKTEKGNVFAFFKAFTLRGKQNFGEHTHQMKLSVGKEILDKLKAMDPPQYPPDLGWITATVYAGASEGDAKPSVDFAASDFVQNGDLPF